MSEKSERIALNARISALKMTHAAQAAHIASSLSVIDILSVLYSDVVADTNGDVVIVSKGHAAAGTYAVMAHSGIMEIDKLETYGVNGSSLGGHVNHYMNEGISLSTGSLGHGLPYGIGIAFSQKKQKIQSRTFVVISDGECDEGTTWESALIANQFNLDNLVLIIDRNRIQSLGDTESTLALEPLAEKWKSFNWEVRVVNGHSHDLLEDSMRESVKPLCVIADTTKGWGVDFMENSVVWHYRPPNADELLKAISQLNSVENEK